MNFAQWKMKIIFLSIIFPAVLIAGCADIKFLTGNKPVPIPPFEGTPSTPFYKVGNLTVARASLHNHTVFSDGVREPEDLVAMARRQGMAILAINDHREGAYKMTNGIRLPINGIEKVGYKAYFDRLAPLKNLDKNFLLLVGFEVNPYLYNIGKFPHMTMLNQLSHFTVYGIDNPEALEKIPAWRIVNSKPVPNPNPVNPPTQALVDYINKNGGMIFGSHMASKQDEWFGPVHVLTPWVIDYLQDIRGIAGFAILPETYVDEAAGPGGIWDATLLMYLMGMRDNAPWAIADADYHYGADKYLLNGTTLFYMNEFTEAEALKCLRTGRVVAMMGPSFQDSYVTEFSVGESGKPAAERIMFGQTVTVSSAPVIRFSLNKEFEGAWTRLIRNGKPVAEVLGTSIEYVDTAIFEKKEPAFYRVEVRGPDREPINDKLNPDAHISRLFTNPIFVKYAENKDAMPLVTSMSDYIYR